MRLDQWLWGVRLYRTRTLAINEIREGHVTVDGIVTKPAYEVRHGQSIAARTGDITRTYRVLAFPPARVGAKQAPEFAEDVTPPEEFSRRTEKKEAIGYRLPDEGRPTKRDRRDLQRWSDPSES
ncbi:MAG: RNA-binding S4 domain-containing protein [Pedosphaera sp.]|nr:RNA-binding S4 domain-containing protein [Pedosphaera sp.]